MVVPVLTLVCAHTFSCISRLGAVLYHHLAPILLSAVSTLLAATSHPWPVNRFRVEGLLPSLPKFLDSSRDHTFTETETVRHVYFSMESLFLAVNRSSNILRDLETLRLLAKVLASLFSHWRCVASPFPADFRCVPHPWPVKTW